MGYGIWYMQHTYVDRGIGFDRASMEVVMIDAYVRCLLSSASFLLRIRVKLSALQCW